MKESEVNSSKEDSDHSDVIGYNNELLPGMVFIVIGGISITITLREEGEHPNAYLILINVEND